MDRVRKIAFEVFMSYACLVVSCASWFSLDLVSLLFFGYVFTVTISRTGQQSSLHVRCGCSEHLSFW